MTLYPWPCFLLPYLPFLLPFLGTATTFRCASAISVFISRTWGWYRFVQFAGTWRHLLAFWCYRTTDGPAWQSGETGGLNPQCLRTKSLSCHSNHSRHYNDKKQPPCLCRTFKRLILCLCGAFPASPLWRFSLSLLFTPDGTSFNIQNPIPHPSQKEKVLLETRRAKERQR